eukprot:scaffold3576_cov170-Amphora_coffeaeformis.AAC.28
MSSSFTAPREMLSILSSQVVERTIIAIHPSHVDPISAFVQKKKILLAKMRTVALIALLAGSAQAFAPNMAAQSRVSVELSAERREIFGFAAAAALSTFGLAMPAGAVTNPALETFKGKKGTKSQYIPGKGLKQHDDMMVAINNPALETFKGKKGTKSQYIPGKGLKQHDDMMVAINNPALETFKGKKGTKSQYIPGKGLKQHDDMFVAINNPALETFKGKKGTKSQYIPGKGLKQHDDIFVAINNPALETFKGKKGTKSQYIPGKGLKMKDFDLFA